MYDPNPAFQGMIDAVTTTSQGGRTGDTPRPGAARVPVTALERTSTEFECCKEPWEQLRLLTGPATEIKENASRFLIRRPKELDDIYTARVADFTYSNVLGNGLGWYVAKLFKDDVQIDIQQNGKTLDTSTDDSEAETDYYGRFLKDCNMSGDSFTQEMQESFRNLCVYGRSYVLVDLDPSKVQADNLDDQIIEPYICLFDPLSVTNHSCDAYGNLEWIVFRTESTATPFLGQSVKVVRWSYYDRQEFMIYEWRSSDERQTGDTENMATLVSTGRHASADYEVPGSLTPGRVPVIDACVPEILWLGGRVYLQALDHINTENTLKWGLFLGNLAMPVIKTKGDYKPQVHAAGAIMLEPGDEFGFAEPTGKTFEISQTRLDSLREDMYRSMYLQQQGRSATATPAAQSGVSKEMDMMPSREVLNSFGNIMRRHILQILEMIAAIRQDEKYEFEIRGLQYNDDPITDDIADTQQILLLGIQSDTFHKEVQKSAVRKFARANSWDSTTIDDVCGEIDAAPTKSDLEDQQQTREDQQMSNKMSSSLQLALVTDGENSTSSAPAARNYSKPGENSGKA